jgi:hypothetical protein
LIENHTELEAGPEQKCEIPSENKKKKAKNGWSLFQEHLPCKALSSNPGTTEVGREGGKNLASEQAIHSTLKTPKKWLPQNTA